MEHDSTVRVGNLNFESHTVMYRTDAGSICQLQRISKRSWAFVYLNRPYLSAVFIRPTVEETLAAAMKKHTLFSASLGRVFGGIFSEIPLK